jgi:hypothetical protein
VRSGWAWLSMIGVVWIALIRSSILASKRMSLFLEGLDGFLWCRWARDGRFWYHGDPDLRRDAGRMMRAEGCLREAGVKNSPALICARYYLSWTCRSLYGEMLDHLLGLIRQSRRLAGYVTWYIVPQFTRACMDSLVQEELREE